MPDAVKSNARETHKSSPRLRRAALIAPGMQDSGIVRLTYGHHGRWTSRCHGRVCADYQRSLQTRSRQIPHVLTAERLADGRRRRLQQATNANPSSCSLPYLEITSMQLIPSRTPRFHDISTCGNIF